MSLNESTTHEPREKWPKSFDIEGVPRDNKIREALMREYQELGEQTMSINHFTTGNIFDPSAKLTVPYVHQEYPKILYSAEYDPAVDKLRARIAAHNKTLRDPLNCRELPERKRLTRQVAGPEEETAAKAAGYAERPFPAEPVVEDDPFTQAFIQDAHEELTRPKKARA